MPNHAIVLPDESGNALHHDQHACCGGLAGWQVKRLAAYIDAHLDSSIRTRELAAVLGLSVSHFTRAFKQAFGSPPLLYVARRRIEAARAMMLATDESLTRVAHVHGFCDQSHFSRTFRRETGTTPQAWRRLQVADTGDAAPSG